MRLIGSCVSLVELDRCCRESAGEVPNAGICRAAVQAGGRRSLSCAREIEGALRTNIFHLEQLTGCASLLERLGYHDRDGLVIMVDVGPTQQLRNIEATLVELAGILRGDD